MKYIMINDISTHTLITQIRKIENLQKIALWYSFRKAIIFFNTSSDEMSKLAQSKFCHFGWYQYLLWFMDYTCYKGIVHAT